MHDPLDRSAGRRSGGVSGRLTGMSTPPALPVRPSGPESGPAPQPSSSRTLEPRSRRELEPRSRRVLQLWDRARPVVRTTLAVGLGGAVTVAINVVALLIAVPIGLMANELFWAIAITEGALLL